MGMTLVSRTFEEWIIEIFDRPSGDPKRQIEYEIHNFIADRNPSAAAEYLSRLFEDPSILLKRFSDWQISLGLEYLLSNAASNYVFVVADDTVPLELRIRVVNSFFFLFRDLFALICSENIGTNHPNRRHADHICFMMWDAGALQLYPDRPRQRPVDLAMLDVLERILGLPSRACQKSALHGLGHAHYDYPDRVPLIIDKFLANQVDLSPDIRKYALNARDGNLL